MLSQMESQSQDASFLDDTSGTLMSRVVRTCPNGDFSEASIIIF